MNKISFHDTHVYLGCPAIILEKVIPNGTTVPGIAEFIDGTVTTAEFEQLSPDELFVRIDAYMTARGTRIPEKSWRLRYDNVPSLWKVVARM